MDSPAKPRTLGGASGITLVELLIVIALLGVLGGIAVVQFGGIVPDAKVEVATDAMQSLNRAVLHYSQAASAIEVEASPGTDDEIAVLTLLKTRDLSVPGSPLVAPNFSETVSSSGSVYRLRWNGQFFEVLVPGVTGSGIVVAD